MHAANLKGMPLFPCPLVAHQWWVKNSREMVGHQGAWELGHHLEVGSMHWSVLVGAGGQAVLVVALVMTAQP